MSKNHYFNFKKYFFSYLSLLLAVPLMGISQETKLEGIYSGNLPCADCQSIKTTLQIKANHQFKITCDYQGVDDGSILEQEGIFTYDETNAILGFKLGKQKLFFQFKNNYLVQLDANMNLFTGENTSNYILTKDNYLLVSNKWFFTEIASTSLPNSIVLNSLEFNDETHNYRANLDCISYSSYFSIEGASTIYMREDYRSSNECEEFKDLVAKLKGALKECKTFEISKNELILFDQNRVVLAKLKMIEN